MIDFRYARSTTYGYTIQILTKSIHYIHKRIMGNKPVTFNIVLNVVNNKWSIWKILLLALRLFYDTNHKVDFYVGHLNPVYSPSGLRMFSLILLITHEGSGSLLSCPTTPQHHLTSCLFYCMQVDSEKINVTVNKMLMWNISCNMYCVI